jgi:uncharacterized protein YgbK (DUF1537 family)
MTAETVLPKAETFAALPAPWPESLEARIRRELEDDGRRLVVLDDDPTGTQTVHGVPVLTEWSQDALAAELVRSPVFYVLTNSRSLPAPEAVELAAEIGRNLMAAASRTAISFAVASRSDSTLRGHYPAEVDATADTLGGDFAGHVLIPFFEAGGRFTLNDIHYVQQGDALVPAAQTEFARDKVFGYVQSSLPRWVEEKTGGAVRARDVVSITIDDLRVGGPEAVTAKLKAMPAGGVAIVNSVAYRDVEVFVAGLLAAERAGLNFIYRTSASFVRVRGGISQRPLLTRAELGAGGGPNEPGATGAGGLVVVGSYVEKTTEQLRAALELPGVEGVELRVQELISPEGGDGELARAGSMVNRALAGGGDVVLFTSRALKSGRSDAENLAIGGRVSRALCGIVAGLAVAPRFLIAKGGITSADVATAGLQVRRAMVLGQVLPGVPVWRLGEESRFPGMSYVVFPGNVGEADALAQAISIFGG